MTEKNQEVVRDARQLGIPKMLFLEYSICLPCSELLFWSSILVAGYFQNACGEPITRGLTVSVTLFCAGIGTLIFHVCSNLKFLHFLAHHSHFLVDFIQ